MKNRGEADTRAIFCFRASGTKWHHMSVAASGLGFRPHLHLIFPQQRAFQSELRRFSLTHPRALSRFFSLFQTTLIVDSHSTTNIMPELRLITIRRRWPENSADLRTRQLDQLLGSGTTPFPSSVLMNPKLTAQNMTRGSLECSP